MRVSFATCWFFCLLAVTGLGRDWPQYRGDAQRSGRTDEALSTNLSLHWVHKAGHPPEPAWPGHDTRMPFDRAFHPVVAHGVLLLGSSADGTVTALDAATGHTRWQFHTGAPVRFSPAVWRDRIFVASDDGFLYCLAVADGRLLWRKRGAPARSFVLGNGYCVSRWPVRGGPVVYADTLYFGAGIWPSEGIFLYALDPATGAVRWANDSAGSMRLAQPHGDVADSGISAQGYLAADENRVYVPTGRAGPAALARNNGTFMWFSLHHQAFAGGSDLVIADDTYYVAGQAGFTANGAARGRLREERVVQSTIPPYNRNTVLALDDGPVHFEKGKIRAFRWVQQKRTNKKGREVRVWVAEPDWAVQPEYGGVSLHAAGAALVSAGAGDKGQGVCLLDVNTKQTVWSASVEGVPYGLAIADGCLYVSTDTGAIFCFAPGAPPRKPRIARARPELPSVPAEFAVAADEIAGRWGRGRGFCVDLRCGDGMLALALAQRTSLHIIAFESDAEQVQTARRTLSRAGLYGQRVQVLQSRPGQTDLAAHVANLVVSGRSVTAGVADVPIDEAERICRPWGGMMLFGRPGAMVCRVQGPLAKAGQWTHQYATAGNALASDDTLVRAPLGVAWYTDWGILMPSRHGRAPCPLFKDGYLVTFALDGLLCADAYNGQLLWQYPLPGIMASYNGEHNAGVARTHGIACLHGHSTFVRLPDHRCLRLSLETGRLQQQYSVPPDEQGRVGPWGIVMAVDGILFGSVCGPRLDLRKRELPRTGLVFRSSELFALDIDSGAPRWRYRARHSIRHNAIAVGKGRVFLVDCHSRESLIAARRKGKDAKASPLELLCLDAQNGKVLWRNDRDIFAPVLALSPEHDVLLLCAQMDLRGFQLAAHKAVAHRLAAVRVSDGRRLWDTTVPGEGGQYVSRPLISGRTVYAQPWAFDLLTGKREEQFLLTGRGKNACGIISGSRNLLLFRSGTLGLVDLLARNGRTCSYGGIRPGCWVNAVAAGGMVLMPDASEICSCSYLIKASVGLQYRQAAVPSAVAERKPGANLPGQAVPARQLVPRSLKPARRNPGTTVPR